MQIFQVYINEDELVQKIIDALPAEPHTKCIEIEPPRWDALNHRIVLECSMD